MTTIPESLQHLNPSQRIELAQALWDSIADQPRPRISEARAAELRRRAAEDDAHPEEAIPWEQVKAEIIAQRSRA